MRDLLSVLGIGLVLSVALADGAFAAEVRVAVIADPGGRQEADTAVTCLERMRRVLTRAGVVHEVLTQEQVLGGALDGFKVAIIPYAPNLSRGARAMLKSFCGDGGKVMCFYQTYGLDAQLGLEGLTYVASPDRTLFCRVRCRLGTVDGLPEGFDQVSWNISSPRRGPGTLVVADWLDNTGKESGHAAATLSDGGLFFSHILLAEGEADETNAGLMLKAVAEGLSRLAGPRRDLVIVYGTVSENTGGSDSRLVGRMVGEMESILSAAGLPYAVLTDEAVARGALKGRKVAILPLNFQVTDDELRSLQRFVADGGKVIGFFSLDSRLLPLMGVTRVQFRAGGASTPFNVAVFNTAAPAGFPERLIQRSGNTMEPQVAPDGRVVATWHDADGADTGSPAVILSPTGMFFSYILWAGDVGSTSQFMLAAIAHLAGERVYEPAAQHLLEGLWDFRRYADRAGLLAACRADARAAEAAAKAMSMEERAQAQLSAGRTREAYLSLKGAREAAELAFVRSLPSRGPREFRGAWLHSPEVSQDDWDGFFAGMRRSHLNALLVNVCTGGYAHYESSVLPLSELIKRRGPQMEKMLAAAKKHGVEVHLWRVNYNLFWPEEAVLNQFIAEKRVCLDPQGNVVGGPNSASLCPSHPANQAREVAAMLEMTSKFHPDGIHFDYIRYPGSEACFCGGCRERFERRAGAAMARWPEDVLEGGAWRQQYLDFRREQITKVVEEVSARSRQIDPAVKISAAVFSDWDTWARDGVAQDWPLWVERGYLDFVCPMDYITDVDILAATVAKQRRWVAGRIPLMAGLGAWQASSAWHTADMVDTARANGADGLVFFEYRGAVANQFIPGLLEGPLREDARTPWAK